MRHLAQLSRCTRRRERGELRDDNFDGRHEKKVVYGVGVFESKVDLPVPTSVQVEPNP